MRSGIEKVRSFSVGSVFIGLAVAVFMAVLAPSTGGATDLGLIDDAALRANTAKWVVIDARPKGEWEAGHIPGAVSLSWENYTRTDEKGIPYSSVSPQEVAAALAALGIDEKTPLVVYGDADKSWGGEGYDIWLLSWLGHKGPLRLLNGGIQSWRAHNLPLAKGQEKPTARKAKYQVTLQPQTIASTDEVEKRQAGVAIVDVRSTLEWLKGRIPGAVHIPWDDFYTGKDRHPLPPAELKKLLAKHGVDPAKPVVFYCLGGIRSAYAWTVARLAGLSDARNYKGSWAAWQKREGK